MNLKYGRFSFPLALISIGFLSAFAGAAPGASRGMQPTPAERSSVERLDSAKAQLERATELKRALRGLQGEARERARSEAVTAYRAVREYFAADAAACAEASFRAGELLRATEDAAGALAEFVIARERGAGTEFRVRAMLEIGHLERRLKHAQPALAAYEAVVAEESATRRQKDEALLWVGRVYGDLERFDDARRVWQKVADGGEDPLDRVRAFDLIACALVETGDLEGAAGVIKRCQDALSDVAAEETKLGERVRSALDAMRSPEQLSRAVLKRKSASDANDAQGDRGSKSGKKTD